LTNFSLEILSLSTFLAHTRLSKIFS
jgi:hypothetical protein